MVIGDQKLCGLSFWCTVRDPYLLLYQSPELASDSNNYIGYVHEALALGAKRIYHYHVMPNAFKCIEPHIALPVFVLSENSQSDKPPKSPKFAVKTSQSVSVLHPLSTEWTEDLKPPSSLSEMIQDVKLRSSRPVRAMEDDIPQGNGKISSSGQMTT